MPDLLTTDKQAILVVGYYRSGTSALCGSLADLGVRISSDAESNEANPKGFFESTELIKFDIRVLELMNAYWSDLSPLPQGWIDRADVQLQRDVLAEILSRQFAGAPLVAMKHPHLCRLLPLYLHAARDAGYGVKVLHTHRSPYAVATSQATKNKMTRAHAIALWSSYITSAEHNARGLPRAWVRYDDLLRDPDATVQAALSAIGIEGTAGRNVDFISRALNRSDPAGAEGLFRPLAQLAADIEAAILGGADAAVWDGLRARSTDLAAFVDELGRSGNRSAPGVGHGILVSTPAGRAVQLAGASKTHPVRPADRGDAVEHARVLDLLKRAGEGGKVANVSVLIACPKGATAAQVRDTLESIAQNWWQPAVKIAFAVAPPVDFSRTDVTLDRRFDSDSEMTKALFAAMATVKTDYAAIVNAGDMLEPDAIARFTLRATASGADMIYCDEIAPSAGGAWVRAKPAMSLPRLLESCFVGDWVWYRRAAVEAIGGFRSDLYPGAEEQDVQIRMAGAGERIEHLSEALFVRGENTRRDSVPLEVATESARASIAAHLARTGTGATVRAGSLPGLFVVEHPGQPDPAVTLGVLCHAPITPDLAQHAVNSLLPHHDGMTSRIVFLRPAEATEAMSDFLDKIATEVTPVHPSVSVIDASPRLGGTLDRLMRVRPGNHVAFVDPVCAPSETDVLGALSALLDALGDAGAIAPLTFFRDAERTARLHGPLLFGANARLGEGYEASSPGPGGWLATTQPVDAVDGPIVLVRRGAGFDPEAKSWSALCASLRAAPDTTDAPRLSAYWTPRRQVEIPDPGQAPSAEVAAARAIPYRGIHHHPAMSLSGSPLLLEGRTGLVGTEAAVLITAPGQPEDAPIIGATRFAREHAGLCAGVVAEPVDALSILRARRQGRRWVRVNPKLPIRHPGTGAEIPADVTVWSALPADEMRDAVCGAERSVATSLRLASRLKGMGARNVTVAPPRLSRAVWSAFTPGTAKPRPVVLWVEETGIDVPWIDQAIRETADQVAWTILSQTSREMPGNVTQRPVPVFEEDWARVLAETGASVLLRPTPGANWCDDYLVVLALAGGCRVIAGKESEIGPDIEPLVTKTLTSTAVNRWVAALHSLTSPDAGSEPAISLRDRLLATSGRWLSPAEGAPDWLVADAREKRESDAA